MFDNDLNCDLAYAWSLPAHPIFERKMELIAVAIDKVALSPLCDYPSCQVFYFKCKIHDIVQVSDIIMFTIKIHLIIFSGTYCNLLPASGGSIISQVPQQCGIGRSQ